MKLEGNRLTLRVPTIRMGGEQRKNEVVWERLK
jgi:hypothetical protein